MFKKLTGEFDFFKSQPKNIRVLILTNMCYAFVLPIVEIFVGAYIMRNTNSSSYVAMYQLVMYAGIVFSSAINGELLKYIKVNILYGFGILVSGLSMLVMMSAHFTNLLSLLTAGFAMGVAAGFFWTNRYLLALNVTNDSNRNYFFGLESFFFSICAIIVPVGVGAFLAYISGNGILGLHFDINTAYQIVTVVTCLITVIACIILSKGSFYHPDLKKYWYFSFGKIWNKFLALASLKGLVQGFLVTTPAILVMKFVGDEGELGIIQGIGGLITALVVYILGRITQQKHRILVLSAGILIFFAGTLVNAILFSAVGVIVFILCKVFFQPLHDLAYYPVMMRTIDVVSKDENRNEYAYIMSHEIGLFIGRALGLGLFILLAYSVSEDFALKYVLVIVALLQILSIPIAKNIIKRTK